MLTCLRIRNFAIIDSLELELGPGLNVLTGETGAGKSIVIQALQLVLGARPRGQSIRTGAKQAEVEALFDIQGHPELAEQLRALEVEVDADREGADGEPLVVRRVLLPSGRTRAYLNGRMVTAQQLAQVTQGLTDISSQHEHTRLIDPRAHLEFLDAAADLMPLREGASEAYENLSRAHRALREFEASMRQREERLDLLRYQLQEIDSVQPEAGELEKLQQKRDRLQHAETLRTTTNEVGQVLYSGDGSVSERLTRAAHEVRHAATMDASLTEYAEQLETLCTQAEELGRELGGYAQGIDANPAQLDRIQERLEGLRRLIRKYGGDLSEVLQRQEQARLELTRLEDVEQTRLELEQSLGREESRARSVGQELRDRRHRAASDLSSNLGRELRDLGMGSARIEVRVATLDPRADDVTVDGARFTRTGMDQAEFLIAPNAGEPVRPLRKIASGGELSRALLGIKHVLAGIRQAGLYVFDEVDVGVGGAIADAIGQKMREVAQHHQVLCITHLAQVASFADHHFVVEKIEKDGRTQSRIFALDESQRIQEVARMLGGARVSKTTREAAKEMLTAAQP